MIVGSGNLVSLHFSFANIIYHVKKNEITKSESLEANPEITLPLT